MSKFLFLLLVFVFFGFQTCEAKAYADPVVALAASCVGEAGWNSVETGECAAILHIYLKISNRTGKPLLEIVKRYSAAIKPRKHHPAKWKLHLSKPGYKPKFWPKKAKWYNYQLRWLKTVEHVSDFLHGYILDPLPCAAHYGGKNDVPHKVLKKIETPKEFSNYFYILKGSKCDAK